MNNKFNELAGLYILLFLIRFSVFETFLLDVSILVPHIGV